MRLGLLYGFSHSHESLDLVLEAERLGLRLGVDRRGLGLGRYRAARLAWRADQENPPRHRDHADAGADARDDGDDRDDARRDVGRTLHPRRRPVGAAGGRGMARSAVRQAAGALPRVHRDPAKDLRARSAAGVPGLRIPGTVPRSGLDRPWQSRCVRSCMAGATWKSTWRRSRRAAWRSQPKSPTG